MSDLRQFMLAAMSAGSVTALLLVVMACGSATDPPDISISGDYEIVVPEGASPDLIEGMRLSSDTENDLFRLYYTKNEVDYVEVWTVTDSNLRSGD